MKKIIILSVLAAILITYSSTTPKPHTTTQYTIQHNDTLWSIAKEHKPESMRYDDYIYQIQKINNIDSVIYPGDVIEIPLYN